MQYSTVVYSEDCVGAVGRNKQGLHDLHVFVCVRGGVREKQKG